MRLPWCCCHQHCQIRFPIPMRGNELPDSLMDALAEIEFPIPMRGNETQVLIREALRDGVSDPHEG